MFKMGCSMARRILTPGSAAPGGDQQQAGCFSTTTSNSSPHGTNNASNSNSNKNGGRGNADQTSNLPKTSQPSSELDDFSKLKQDPRLPLNVRQIFKITKSWKAIARTTSKTGTAMFLALFEQNENLFHLFDRFQHLKGKELHDSMELREHAATVMATLDTSINSLSDYDNFVSYLHSIGQLHRKVPGFKREYFWEIEQPFMKAVKQTLDERCNETIEEIYKIAIKLIIETIAVGYGEDSDGAPGAGRRNAPSDPEQSRQGGGSDGSSSNNNNNKSGGAKGPSNDKGEDRPGDSIGDGGTQRARQCQQRPGERKTAPSCPLHLAHRALGRFGGAGGATRSAMLQPGNSGGDHSSGNHSSRLRSGGELVGVACKLMSTSSETLAGTRNGTRREKAGRESSAKSMNWRPGGLLAGPNQSLMNGGPSERTEPTQQNNGQNQAKRRQHRTPTAPSSEGSDAAAWQPASSRVSRAVRRDVGVPADAVPDLPDDCGRTHLDVAIVAATGEARMEQLDGGVQKLERTRESDEKKRAFRAIDPIESQVTNWAARSHLTAAQRELDACPSPPPRRPDGEDDDDKQTLSGDCAPGDRARGAAEAPLGPESSGALRLRDETSARRLLLDIRQLRPASEHSAATVVDAELAEFIKVIILISKLSLALDGAEAATAKRRQTTLAETFMSTTPVN